MNTDAIRCEGLDLVLMTPAFIERLLANDDDGAERELGVRLGVRRWAEPDAAVLVLRLAQVRAEPAAAPWLLRAIVLPDRTMIGHAGFHGPPDADGYAELGYTVFAPFRRRGYARAAATCLMRWAGREHGVRRFRLSIGPENTASLALAESLAFRRTGEQMDEVDGLEWIFTREGAPAPVPPSER